MNNSKTAFESEVKAIERKNTVVWLREQAQILSANGRYGGEYLDHAADKIESLQDEVEELREKLAGMANAGQPETVTTGRILCLDFDGVLHSYTSGWMGADNIPDPPVPGAMDFLCEAVQSFDVQIFSSRSHQEGGIAAMREWVKKHLLAYWSGTSSVQRGTKPYDIAFVGDPKILCVVDSILSHISFPLNKPPAHVTIDDRAITFTGNWPNLAHLHSFKPWNRKSHFYAPTETGEALRAMDEARDNESK